jgi:hypothetical protein
VQDDAQQGIVDPDAAVYSMNPSRRSLFRKKFTRDRVVPIISASGRAVRGSTATPPNVFGAIRQPARPTPRARFLEGGGPDLAPFAAARKEYAALSTVLP